MSQSQSESQNCGNVYHDALVASPRTASPCKQSRLPGTLPGMKCAYCLYFKRPYRYRPGDMPDSVYGYCDAGTFDRDRAMLINKAAICRYNPPRFQQRSKS